MEEMQQSTKIILTWELYEGGVPKGHIAQQLGINRETVRIWIHGIQRHAEGLLGFLEQYRTCKKGLRTKRKVDGLLKARIYRLREENRSCCGQKIQLYLEEEFGIHVSTTTIYEILAEKYKLRSKWKKNQHRGELMKATKPREVIQMDTVHFGMVFAFTSVDTFARDVSVKLYPTLTSSDGKDFLTDSFQKRFHHTELLQTDGGPEFKGEFRQSVFTYADRFRVARPYKKNEQSFIESFNRTLRKECLGWANYHPKDIPEMNNDLTAYLKYYHDKRAHLSLDMKTPNAILKQYNLMADI
jgi:predicted transcriptional regulator